MQKVIQAFLVFFIVGLISSFQEPQKDKINWISIQDMNELYAKESKPVLVDVYTDWCGWCKEMDRKTYTNKKLIKYINEHYYAVKLNAESTEKFVFNNKQFGYNSQYQSNELAAYLLLGQMEYPTTVFLSAIDAKPAPLSGYMTVKDMEAPLKYFGEGNQEKQTFIEFNKALKKEW